MAAAPWQTAESRAEQPASQKRTKIVLIGHKPDHPPGTHLYLHECGLLAKCLRQTPNVEAVVSDGWPADAAVLEGVSAIALYTSPGAEILLKGKQREQVEKLLKAGVGLTALHWATGIGNKDDTELADRYLAQLGGLFSFAFSGLATTRSKAEQIDPKHPICRGWSDYELLDEFYLDLKYMPQAKPILKIRLAEKEHTVAWAYERPNSNGPNSNGPNSNGPNSNGPNSNGGRSFGNVLGHFHELFTMEPFRRTIVNGILWTAHREIPSAGAPCRLTPEEMKLPG